MLTEINGSIKIADDDKVVLEIAQNDLEKFKEYKHPADPKKFYADFSLDDKQLCMTGSSEKTEENQKDNTVIIFISSANKQGNGKASTAVADIKTLFGLDNEKKEVKVQMLKHPREQVEELKSKVKDLEAQLKQQQPNVDKLKTDLEAKNTEAAKLQTDLKAKEEEIAQLKQQQPNVDKLKTDLAAQKTQIDKLQKEKKELEAEKLNVQQPKQSNAAKYTATVGMGLAAGLIAFTALERTVRLEMLVIIGIAVASALVAGGITYAALPSTQVDGAEAQNNGGCCKT